MYMARKKSLKDVVLVLDRDDTIVQLVGDQYELVHPLVMDIPVAFHI